MMWGKPKSNIEAPSYTGAEIFAMAGMTALRLKYREVSPEDATTMMGWTGITLGKPIDRRFVAIARWVGVNPNKLRAALLEAERLRRAR